MRTQRFCLKSRKQITRRIEKYDINYINFNNNNNNNNNNKTLLKTHRKITHQILVIILIIKTLFTISFDKKEEHLDLVRKKIQLMKNETNNLV